MNLAEDVPSSRDINDQQSVAVSSNGKMSGSAKAELIATIAAVALGILAAVGTFFALIIFVPVLPPDLIIYLSVATGLGVGVGLYFACTAIVNKILKNLPQSSSVV